MIDNSYYKFEECIINDNLSSFKDYIENNIFDFDVYDYSLIFRYNAISIFDWFWNYEICDNFEWHMCKHFNFTISAKYLALYCNEKFIDNFIEVNKHVYSFDKHIYDHVFFIEVIKCCLKYQCNNYALEKFIKEIYNMYQLDDNEKFIDDINRELLLMFDDIDFMTIEQYKIIIDNTCEVRIDNIAQLDYLLNHSTRDIDNNFIKNILNSLIDNELKVSFNKQIMEILIKYIKDKLDIKDFKELFIECLLKQSKIINEDKELKKLIIENI